MSLNPGRSTDATRHVSKTRPFSTDTSPTSAPRPPPFRPARDLAERLRSDPARPRSLTKARPFATDATRHVAKTRPSSTSTSLVYRSPPFRAARKLAERPSLTRTRPFSTDAPPTLSRRPGRPPPARPSYTVLLRSEPPGISQSDLLLRGPRRSPLTRPRHCHEDRAVPHRRARPVAKTRPLSTRPRVTTASVQGRPGPDLAERPSPY
jgi:hypothetical protein